MKFWKLGWKTVVGLALLACASAVWAAPDWTQGRIVKVEPEKARVTLKHQRIKSIAMEAMTMPFKVAEDVDLTSFTAGDTVRFTVTMKDDHLVIDKLERVK
jgi:Cu/Ag efflux protein CusF